MMNSIQSAIKLNNGVLMPRLGLGVFKVDPAETKQSVLYALEAGYKAIDTAAIYGNEAEVGQAIKESGMDRKELFITTKLWNEDHGYDTTKEAFERSMERLGLDYLDLYLIHWPGKDRYVETYKAMEELYKAGRIRAIGVSNFKAHHLETLMENTKVIPAVNQIEMHPFLCQPQLRDWCQARNIAVEAWCPIARGKVNESEELAAIAKVHGKSIVQIVLRWHLQHDVIVIPKSIHKDRIIANAEVWDFELNAEEMKLIDAIDSGSRLGPDPDAFLF